MSDSKETTNNNIPLFSNATQQQIEDFNLSKNLLDFLWNEPFYSRILRSLNKVETTEIPTAGVTCTDEGDLTLYWNRSFLAGLTKQQINGLLKHECLHLVFGHTTDRRKDPHIIWNYATDLAINSTIPFNELPKGGFVPGKRLPNLEKEQLDMMSQEDVEHYSNMSNLIESLEPNKTSEYYFSVLENNEVIKKELERQEVGSKVCFGFDDHEGWDNLNEEAKEQIKAKIKEISKEALQEASERGWGSLPANIARDIKKLYEKSIKWTAILKRFCGFTKKNDRISSIKRVNRKYPHVHPGIKKDYKPMIAVYLDESGSVSDAMLSKFYSEIDSLSKNTDFYVYKFDAEVDDENGFLWKKGQKVKLNRTKVGGTCFQAVTDHANKNKKKFDGYIIFTDGYAPKPTNSKLKRCWVIPESCKLDFKKDNSDILINVK